MTDHLAAHVDVSARWVSNFIDGVGSERLFVGEHDGDGYRTRMLELTLVSSYDPQTGKDSGHTQVQITECICPATVTRPQTPFGLELGCECEAPPTICRE